jgi:YD repeat-containing protein
MNAKIGGMIFIAMGLGLALALVLTAHAPAAETQRRYYDARGNSLGTSSTDSQGTTTFYDARGQVIGKASKK